MRVRDVADNHQMPIQLNFKLNNLHDSLQSSQSNCGNSHVTRQAFQSSAETRPELRVDKWTLIPWVGGGWDGWTGGRMGLRVGLSLCFFPLSTLHCIGWMEVVVVVVVVQGRGYNLTAVHLLAVHVQQL